MVSLCGAIFSLFSIALLSGTTAMAAAVDLDADQVEKRADGAFVATGSAHVVRAGTELSADSLTYHPQTRSVDLYGQVRMEDDARRIEAASGHLDLVHHTGQLHQVNMALASGEHAQARDVQQLGPHHFSLDQLKFTSCPTDDAPWWLHAAQADLDQDAGVLTARHVRFVMGGVPLLYSPYWQHPLRRRSGLLLPQVGFGKRRGSEVALPLYWAPAANWDATLTPHWMTARGLQLALQGRHAWAKGSESLTVEGLHDRLLGTNRKAAAATVQWQVAPSLDFMFDGKYVGDRSYIADFSTDSSFAASRYLTSQAALRWQGEHGYSRLSAMRGQDLVMANDATTLQILPRLESSHRIPLGVGGLVLGLDQQSTNFSRTVGVAGVRLDIAPYLELPWQMASGGASALLHVGVRHGRYWLRNGVVPRRQQRTSVESSLTLQADVERVSSDRRWRHVISPILRYDHVSAPEQSALPNFDSTFARLTMGNLLSANRFTGRDRVERANRVALLLEQRLQHKQRPDAAARQWVQMAVGLSYDMLRRSVDTALIATPSRPWSNLVGEVKLSPWSSLELAGEGQFDPVGHFWARSAASTTAHDGRGDRLRVGFQRTDARYAAAESSLDVAGTLAFVRRWSGRGSWHFDLRQHLTRNANVALEYQHPCWMIGIEAFRNTLASASSARGDVGFRLEFSLKGVGG
ncbi:MAG: LPS assembly protein LptD [Mariprofundales bacterium]